MSKKLAKKLLAKRQKEAKEMVGVVKQFTVSKQAISIDEKNHTVDFIMSTENVDRHGDIVDQDSWNLKWFNENPMFFLQHRSSDFPIGKWIKVWFEDDPDNQGKKMLVGRAKFSVDIDENAKRAWDHVVAGNMGAVSVGFIPHVVDYDEDRDAFVLKSCELLECSLVGVPSNRQALAKQNTETKKSKKGVKEVKKEILEKQNVNQIINAKESIDNIIRLCENEKVDKHLRARVLLNKAIRGLK